MRAAMAGRTMAITAFQITPGVNPFQELQKIPQLFREEIQSGLHLSQQEWNILIGIAIALIVILILVSIVMTIARFVAETAVIRMVDEYEKTGSKPGVRQGFRYGWSRASWRLFLINLLVNLPLFLLVLFFLGLGIGMYLLISQGIEAVTITTIVAGIGIAFLLIFLFIILYAVLLLLRHFFWRACALEQVGVIEALRRGYGLVRRNWKNVGLMWLIMIGLGILWAIAGLLIFILMLPLFVATILGGVIVGGVPTLLVAAISSLFVSGWVPWVIGALVGFPLFILIAFSPMILVGAWVQVFKSTVWTLTYRELKTLETITPALEPVPDPN